MTINGWTHALLDLETGALLGVAKDLDNVEDFGTMGTALYFTGDGPHEPQYNWLRNVEVLPVDQLDANTRAEIVGELTYALPV